MVLARALVHEEAGTVRHRRRAQARPRPLPGLRPYLYVLCGCLVLFGANAMLHGLVTASSARIDALAGELLATQQEAEEIDIEIAYLSSYPRIAREAESRLAMHAPGPGDYRFVALTSPVPYPGTTAHAESPAKTGLVASLGDWLRTFGRTEASVCW